MKRLLAGLFIFVTASCFAQQTGGRGVPGPGGAVNCGGVPGGTSTTGCGGVPGNSGASITYVNTTFNEASASTPLAGTTPATCSNGCIGPWTLPNGGTDFTYTGSSSVTTTTPNPSDEFDQINTGVADSVIRWNMSACAGTSGGAFCQILVRRSSGDNYIAVNCYPTSNVCQMFDGPSFSQIGGSITGSVDGSYTMTLTGSSILLSSANGSISGTTGNTSGTDVAFYMGGTGTLMSLTSFSVKSN